MSKIGIVGCGFVGSTIAYTLACTGLTTDIVLVDINRNKAEGDAMDISHGLSFIKPVNIYAGNILDLKELDIIIITAGANITPEKSRLELVNDNANIFKELIPKIAAVNDKAIYIIVSNPVDILTYITCKISGMPSNKIIGSGTVLDSSRFRSILSSQFNVDPRNIHGYIIGEHGDSEIAAWSATSISGMSINEYCNVVGYNLSINNKNEIQKLVRTSGFDVIKKKGVTHYAVSLAVIRIIECIIRDEKSILTVSSLIDGQYGIKDVALSLPTIVSDKGIDKVIEIKLEEEELKAFKNSAKILKKIIKDTGF